MSARDFYFTVDGALVHFQRVDQGEYGVTLSTGGQISGIIILRRGEKRDF